MKNANQRLLACAGALLLLAGGCHSDNHAKQAAANPPAAVPLLQLQHTVPLPHVKGGFDLMALDAAGQRLFVAAEDNHTVEVLDVRSGRALASLPGFNEPKWVVYRPEGNRVFVSTGDGRVTELDGKTYQKVRSYAFREACNNLRYDSLPQQLVVGVGKSFGALGLIDTERNVKAGEIPLAGYAKQFELDGNRIYVNEPALNQVEVIDRTTRKPVATWPVTGFSQNIPMALDRVHHRLFVACAPGQLVVFSTSDGKPVAKLSIPADADGIYYDARRVRLYISCGAGSIAVVQQQTPDRYQTLQLLPTVPGAGTSLYSAALDAYFLATPQAAGRVASLRVYRVEK
ncbi:YncE family protein [Hymenobacter profundi]|uniref:PQQ-binding-like beta-propeller repeat protein n=1 Tax=Hymenobacter profundi TaxID=1982110 RepID=A0ABS6WUA0_9BACT|nr:hypothetical protein [Hymenobacter profundi]MBW3127160.1 PQQ-binding-like beta-propeller repeat protein [Hymenobacter profundi]